MFTSCLKAINPERLLKSFLSIENDSLRIRGEEYYLPRYNNIYIIGAGKASAVMAKAIEDILGNRITKGCVVVKYGHSVPCRYIQIHEAAHPVPDKAGVDGTVKILEILEGTTENDLIIVLISGGGSALLCKPAEGISLEDKQITTNLLMKSGADITELNAIRKHLSLVKGGLLARAAYPSELLVFILSDVINDPLDSIASGPTVADTTTFYNCRQIISKYNLEEKIPKSVINRFNQGESGIFPENPQINDDIFNNVSNFIIGNNSYALHAAEKKANELNYNTHVIAEPTEGETKDSAHLHTSIAISILENGKPIRIPACVLSGGETTVTIKGNGLGGRNQEFVLASVEDISGLCNIVVLSGGTDGSDGPTDAAGAIADNNTMFRANELELNPADYLENNDSYHFFHELHDLIITGPTKTNVMDIHLLLIDK
ncbi:MAG: glycerate kinase [candidate division Zixibacteria bacterium]|nr:glycerate kinase [candidate division Zixibacteria bacterium]